MTRVPPEEEKRLKARLIAARIGLIVLIVGLIVLTGFIEEPASRNGFRKWIVIFGVGALLTSGSIADQVKYRAWRKKIERR